MGNSTRRVFKTAVTGALTAAILVGTGVVAAHDSKKERNIESKYRHDVMEQVKYSASNIRLLARGYDGGQADAMALNIENLFNAAKLSKGAFKKDTRGDKGHTEAKDAIWEDWADFASRTDKFVADIETLKAAQASGDQAAFGQSLRGVFGNCQSCHKKYKAD